MIDNIYCTGDNCPIKRECERYSKKFDAFLIWGQVKFFSEIPGRKVITNDKGEEKWICDKFEQNGKRETLKKT